MTRRAMVVVRAALAVASLVLHATPSGAHAVGVSRGEYRVEGSDVHADLVFARAELAVALPALDADRNGALTSAELRGTRHMLAPWLFRGVLVRAGDEPCSARWEEAGLTEQDGVRIAALFACPGDARGQLSVRLSLLSDLTLGHRHLATVTSPVETTRTVLYEARPALTVAGATASAPALETRPASVAPALFRLGVEHILTGYDHLLFLLALVLVGAPLRKMVGLVTAFTLAHSVTLAVAALGLWTPRASIVEPAIALSIAYVGIENCIAPSLRRRWRLAFLFGLVHGFGFAGALREVALSAEQLPLALASFNIGVEAGQLAVLALALPLVSRLAERTRFVAGTQFASMAISATGLWWFVERVTAG